MDKTGAIQKVERDGKTYLALRISTRSPGVGLLLAELMRIKAEGDYAAIKAWWTSTACTSTQAAR